MLRPAIGDGHVAARHRSRQEQGAGHDAIGNDLILDAVELLYALDRYRVGSLARDPRTHRNEKVGQVDDLGLHRHVL